MLLSAIINFASQAKIDVQSLIVSVVQVLVLRENTVRNCSEIGTAHPVGLLLCSKEFKSRSSRNGKHQGV